MTGTDRSRSRKPFREIGLVDAPRWFKRLTTVTGVLISRDDRRLTLSGNVLGPSIGGLISTAVITSCGISLSVPEVEFANGRAGRIAYRATGRCPGTAGGRFELRR